MAIGLYCAALLSNQLGYLDNVSLALISSLLTDAQLPHKIPKGIDLVQLHGLMFNDKKIINKTLRFVLMRALGDCYLDSGVTADSLHHVLVSAVEGDHQ